MSSLRLALALPALTLALACPPGSPDDAGPLGDDAGIADDGGVDSDAGASDDDAGSTADAGPFDGRCRTSGECQLSDIGAPECALPDAIAFPQGVCGACLDEPDQCADDDECGSGFVCRREGACGCGVFAAICVDGCASGADCLTGQTCDGDAHCVTTSCDTPDDCPDQFGCDAEQCVRVACTDDSACTGGFCVGGLCFGDLGTCVQVVGVP